MHRIITGLFLLLLATSLAACYPAEPTERKLSSARVTCYSGGALILDDYAIGEVYDFSTGQVQYTSSLTGRKYSIFADCVVEENTLPSPPEWQPLTPATAPTFIPPLVIPVDTD